MSKKKSNKSGNNWITNIMIGIIVILLIVIAYLGINVLKTSKELGEIDKQVAAMNEQDNQNNQSQSSGLKASDSLNTTQIKYTNQKEKSITNIGLDLKISENNESATLTINWKTFGNIINNEVSDNYPTSTNNYEVKGFNKKIKSALIGQTNNNLTSLTLIFLMDDGTVEYAKLFKDDQNKKVISLKKEDNTEKQYIQIDGTVSKVTDVYKLYNIDADNNNDTYKTIVGVKSDNKFYDLGYAIENTK